MVARGPGPHRGLGKPEREDPARVEGPAPGVRFHMFNENQNLVEDILGAAVASITNAHVQENPPCQI